MKKVLALILAAALVLGLAVSAAAVESAGATRENLLPTLRSSTCDEMIMYIPEEFDQLSEEENAEIWEGMAAMEDAIPDNMRARFVFWVDICEECNDCDAVFVPSNGWEATVLQFVDGEWVELEVKINEDGTITVYAMTDGLVVFLTGTKPVLVSSSCEHAAVYAEDEVKALSTDIQNEVKNSKRNVADAAPEGMLIRYFFYIDICDECGVSTDVFQVGEFTELVVKQFVDGEWVELPFTDNGDGTITVDNVTDAPMAFYVK